MRRAESSAWRDAILFSANKISKGFGARPLFDGLSFSVEDEDRIGLIGPNGAGKSTLLRIIATETVPDSGDVSFRRGLTVGFLEQNPKLPASVSVEHAVRDAVRDPHND